MKFFGTIGGLLTIMWGGGRGLEIMKRIVGELTSATNLTLIVLPLIYALILEKIRKWDL
jgi:Cu/Ag efflux pump CusA